MLVTLEPASAANSYDWGRGSEVAAPAPLPVQTRKRTKSARPHLPELKLTEKDKPSGPLIINISIQNQRMKIYDSRGLYAESPVSTGMAGHLTPLGVFSVIEKQKWHRSNIYSGAPMPYMQRITWSGVAMHQGVLPGYPASHGCIRLPAAFAIKLWAWTQRGARVIITPGEISPSDFAHPKLIAQMEDAPTLAAAPLDPASTTGDTGSSAGKIADRLEQQTPVRAELRLATLSQTVGSDAAPASKSEGGQTSTQLAAETAPKDAEGTTADPQAKATEPAAQAAEKQAATAPQTAASMEPGQTPDPASGTETPGSRPITASAQPAPEANASEPAAPQPAAQAPAAQAPAAQAAATPPVPSAPAEAQSAVTPAKLDPAIAVPAADPKDIPTVVGPKRTGHLAVFISRKDRKLYVRQNFSPVFDVPIEIADADKPLGTFVLTARGDKDDAKALHWSMVALPVAVRRTVAGVASHHGKPARPITETTLVAATTTAAEALDRITIPEAARERIAQAIKPGGSIVISDHGLGDETGLGTDFIVPLR